jgi:hypothetical protein
VKSALSSFGYTAVRRGKLREAPTHDEQFSSAAGNNYASFAGEAARRAFRVQIHAHGLIRATGMLLAR